MENNVKSLMHTYAVVCPFYRKAAVTIPIIGTYTIGFAKYSENKPTLEVQIKFVSKVGFLAPNFGTT